MAASFDAQIHALSGFDADTASASAVGDDFDELAAQWMTEAYREVINVLPRSVYERCAETSAAFDPGTGQVVEGRILSVIRTRDAAASFTTVGNVFECRQIPHSLVFKAADPDSIEYATPTDPVYYYEPQVVNTAVTVKVLPDSASNVAKITKVSYRTFVAGGSTDNDISKSTIPNFPDEAIHLVVLRAAIYAAEYMMTIEEDIETFMPIIANLKEDFKNSLNMLKTGTLGSHQQAAS